MIVLDDGDLLFHFCYILHCNKKSLSSSAICVPFNNDVGTMTSAVADPGFSQEQAPTLGGRRWDKNLLKFHKKNLAPGARPPDPPLIGFNFTEGVRNLSCVSTALEIIPALQ